MTVNLTAVGLMLCALALPAYAQTVDRVAPSAAQLCINCHNQTADQQLTLDAQLIPLLGTQQPKYLESAILAYARRQRDHFFMRGVAAGLNPEERDSVVQYFASASTSTSRSSAQVQMPASAAQCVACHGDSTQRPSTEDIPRLAGQHQAYLKGAFLGYATGSRRHPVMQAIAAGQKGIPTLTQDDLEAVTKWFSRLPGGLSGK